jgi:hypothetical protein
MLACGVVRFAPLRITNGGSLDFTYVMSTAVTGSAPLAAALTIGIKVVPSATCNSTTYAASSTVAYAEAAGISRAVIASRPLTSGASEFLCYRVELPSSAGNTLQGARTDATFTFPATS